MCHPGYRSTSWDEFNMSVDREHELNTIKTFFVKDLISRDYLVDFATLKNKKTSNRNILIMGDLT